MDKKEWDEWAKLYEDYEAKRVAYEKAHDEIRGTFSELARHYEAGSFDQNGFVREAEAHEAFLKAREKLHAFVKAHVLTT